MIIPWLSPSWWQRRRFIRHVEQQAADALQATADAWMAMREVIHLDESTTLMDRVEMFLPPIMERYKRDFPLIFMHPDLLWQTIFAAISASGTERPEDIEELRNTLLRVRAAKR